MAIGKIDLVHGDIRKALIVFALPTLASSILNSVNGTIASAWVGHLIGPQALAATMSGNIVMMLLYSGAFGLGMAISIIIAQAFGASDMPLVKRAMGNGLAIFICLSIVLFFIGWFEATPILQMLATPEPIFQDALAYFKTLVITLPFYLITVLYIMALRGTGDSITPLMGLLISVMVEIIFCPILISGLGPFPELGIAGAGYANLLGNIAGLSAIIFLIYRRDLPIRLHGAEIKLIRFYKELTIKILAKGLPISLQMMIVSLAALSIIGLINSQGVVVASAYAMAQQIWPYLQLPAMAISASVSAMVAQNIGANQWPRVNQITLWGVIYAVSITAIFIILVLAFDTQIFSVFADPTSPQVPVAIHIEKLTVIAFIFFAITSILMSTVRANGSVWVPLIILSISQLPVRLGIAYWMRDYWGQDALWLSFPAANIVSMLLMAAHYFHGGWRRNASIVEEVEEPPTNVATRNCPHPVKAH